MIGQALARRAGIERRQFERHPQRRFDGGAERDQKIIAGRGQDAAMEAQIRFGIGAAVHAGGVHLAIGPLDAREVGVGAAFGADRAGFRLDDPAHLQQLLGEILGRTLRPGPFQQFGVQHVPVDAFADMGAGLLPCGDQSLGLEHRQRFPDRGAADVELRGEFDLARQGPAFMPDAGHDQPRDLAGDVGVGLALFGLLRQQHLRLGGNIVCFIMRCMSIYCSKIAMNREQVDFDSQFYVGHIMRKIDQGGVPWPDQRSTHSVRGREPPKAAAGRRRDARRRRVSAACHRAVKTLCRRHAAWRVVPAPFLHAAAELHSRIRSADRHEGRPAALGVSGLQPAGQSRIVVGRLGLRFRQCDVLSRRALGGGRAACQSR